MKKRLRKKKLFGLKKVLVVSDITDRYHFSSVYTYRIKIKDYREDMPKNFLNDHVAISCNDIDYLLDKISILRYENQKQKEAMDKYIFDLK